MKNTINRESNNRRLLQSFKGVETSDGAGVKLTRIIGSPKLNMLDPFLLLDCFESDDAADYIGGFPAHPHRGFETVTYILDGCMRHRDNFGHEGIIEAGGVQWMTAGRGILHSEMPEQKEGLLKGFQLWINLPASAKMIEPTYQEYSNELTPIEHRPDGTLIRVISGQTNQGIKGPINNDYVDPIFLDVALQENTSFLQQLPESHNAFVYLISGNLNVIGEVQDLEFNQQVTQNELCILSKGDQLLVKSDDLGARFLLLAARPLNEPVVRSGPFVMNTKEEIFQAYEDFSSGNF